MKFSIFLYLLPFSLSVPPPTFPFHITQPYCPPLESTSPLFEILDVGIYIWKIPNLVRNEDESSHRSTSYSTRKLNTEFSHKLSIYWPKEPVLIKCVQLSELNEINMEFLTEEAYILLKVNEDKTCQLSYWMGNNSNLSKRRITARFVVRLMHDLQTQINEANLNFISREQQYRESAEFKFIFNLGSGNLSPRLYKLTGRNDDVIKTVPLTYSELNGIDTFVLDEISLIKIWSASLNIRKKGVALALADYINSADRLVVTKSYQVQIGNELTGRDFLIFQQQFLHHFRDNPSRLPFPGYSLEATSNEQQQEERNLKLLMYSIYENRVYSQEILERPLTQNHFEPDKTYIMIDNTAGIIFIIIGICGHTAVIEDVMANAEQLYSNSVRSIDKKIIIIRHTDRYPTPFFVNLEESKSFVNDYIARYH